VEVGQDEPAWPQGTECLHGHRPNGLAGQKVFRHLEYHVPQGRAAVLEGREVEVKVADGTGRRYVVDHAERLDDGLLSVSLRPAAS
jgi:hypothetical protein